MAKKRQLRSLETFFPGTPEEAAEDGAEWVLAGQLVDVDDPRVEGREEYFEPA